MKRIIFLGIIITVLSSCEEEIDYGLKNAEKALVVEATINNMQGQTVKISATTDYFDPTQPEMKSGALVRILDDLGNQWHFQETGRGYYQNEQLTGKPGRTYRLEVLVDGNIITGVSRMQPVVPIDSLWAEYFPGTRFADPGYFLLIKFTDPSGPDPDYYRVKMFNGEKQSTVIQLLDDRLTNGNQITFFLFGGSYQKGDTAVVELESLDYDTYMYYYTLNNVLADEQQGTTANPANPNTNLSGNTLGYFGAIAVSRDTLILPGS